MAAYLSPIGNEQQSDSNGAPVSGALINTYIAGTTTPVVTYTDAAGLVPQSNPIVCNAAGYPASPIFLPAGVAVKMVFTTSVASGSVAYRPPVDNITGVNDPSFATTVSEWTAFSGTPLFISATSFSVTGDQTNILSVGRQLRTTNTGGTIYSTITASVFGSVTTVTVANVAGVLDSGLSAVSYGLLNSVNPSLPRSAAVRTALAVPVQAVRVDVATAATLDITGTSPNSDDIRTTGTTTITAVNLAAGRVVRALAGSSYTITNAGAISCVNGANIVARAGDMVTYRATALNTAEVSIVRANPINIGTATVTTSGTSVDVTGIPADAKRVTITFNGVSTTGTSPPQLQVGNGAVVTSGYLGSNSIVSATPGSVLFTAAFGIGVNTSNWTGAVVVYGQIVLQLHTGNTWACTGSVGRSDTGSTYLTNGIIALGSALDRIRLTTAGGVETFDAGSITVTWES